MGKYTNGFSGGSSLMGMKAKDWVDVAFGSIAKKPIINVIIGNSRTNTSGGRQQGITRAFYELYGKARMCMVSPMGVALNWSGSVYDKSYILRGQASVTLPEYSAIAVTQKENIWWQYNGSPQLPLYIPAGSSTPGVGSASLNINPDLIEMRNLEIIVADRPFSTGTGSFQPLLSGAFDPTFIGPVISTNTGVNATTSRITRVNTPGMSSTQRPGATATSDWALWLGGGSPAAVGPLMIVYTGIRDAGMAGGWGMSSLMAGGGLNTAQLADLSLYGTTASERQEYFRSLIAMAAGPGNVRPLILLNSEFGLNTNPYPAYTANRKVLKVTMSTTTAGTFQYPDGNNYAGYTFQLLRLGYPSGGSASSTYKNSGEFLVAATIATHNPGTGAFTLNAAMSQSGGHWFAAVNNVGGTDAEGYAEAYRQIIRALLADINAVGGADGLAFVTAGTAMNDSGFEASVVASQAAIKEKFKNDDDVLVVDTHDIATYAEILAWNTVLAPVAGDEVHPNALAFAEVNKRVMTQQISPRNATTMVYF